MHRSIKGSGNPILDEIEIHKKLRAHKDRVNKARFKCSSNHMVNDFYSTSIDVGFKDKLPNNLKRLDPIEDSSPR